MEATLERTLEQLMSASHTTFIGTNAAPDEDGVYQCAVDRDTGHLEIVEAVAVGRRPNFLAVHPTDDYLYTVCSSKPGTAHSIAFDETGDLSVQNQVPTGGSGPCHCSVDASGQYLLVAHYSGGSVSMLPIDEDGTVSEPSHVVEHGGSSVVADRQSEPHPHSITPGPDNRVAYVPDLGTDEVVCYDMDLDAGRLERRESVDVHDGAGPRHLSVHPSGDHVYLVGEIDSTVITFERAVDGSLSELATASTLPESAAVDNTAADVHVHPTGEYVYVSNRGHDSIAQFDIGPDGRPSLASVASTVGKWPRNFALDPDGSFLFSENKNSDEVRTFGVDPTSGELEPTGSVLDVPTPCCMKFQL